VPSQTKLETLNKAFIVVIHFIDLGDVAALFNADTAKSITSSMDRISDSLIRPRNPERIFAIE